MRDWLRDNAFLVLNFGIVVLVTLLYGGMDARAGDRRVTMGRARIRPLLLARRVGRKRRAPLPDPRL